MEFIVVLAVIIVLLLIIGVKAELIIAGVMALAALILVSMILLLFYFFIRMMIAKKCKAEFSRIDKAPGRKFSSAFYIIDGVEYPCIFPDEGMLRTKLYKKDKLYTVRLDRRGKFLFDRFACATCITGVIFGTLIIAAALWLWLSVKGG